ncbi:outer membrane protein assembly factor BamE [Ottowia sp. GY511]|uniref:Outer membrane protein assembly factor BamE n=1 Tax=Ottowia flava TaxID=2675430 RepID=A0ABW4KWV3_9BURK|nr:outer membrane protein assembly factor BamE [Ottowia sp. GY511]TXK22047.1 outer membrane protein assembly factor BamE [Ottowia sp. GY511]
MSTRQRFPVHRGLLLAATALLAASAAHAQSTFNGWLCCNMRTDGGWISEINYDSARRVIPAGTPVQITGYGRYRVHTLMNGEQQDLGNDYSREIDMGAFAHRYVVPYNPQRRLRAAPPAVQQAVRASRVRLGMTREQVAMSLGYPIANETPSLDNRVWKYWRSSGEEFHVIFNRRGVVESIRSDDPDLRARVTAR